MSGGYAMFSHSVKCIATTHFNRDKILRDDTQNQSSIKAKCIFQENSAEITYKLVQDNGEYIHKLRVRVVDDGFLEVAKMPAKKNICVYTWI